MDWVFLFKGIAIGFSIAAPVGPIGVLCIRRSLESGWACGFMCGLGAATADAVYGFIAAFGLTAISVLLISCQGWISLAGGLFLCYLGYGIFKSTPPAEPQSKMEKGYIGPYFSTFFLTLLNPMTIVSFAAIFTGLGIAAGSSYTSAVELVVGVFTGSALWWLGLSSFVSLFRTSLSPGGMKRLNMLSGVIVFSLGVFTLNKAW